MPREESAALQEIESAGAREAIDQTVDEMADAYTQYVQSIRRRLGSSARVKSKLREDIASDIRRRLEAI